MARYYTYYVNSGSNTPTSTGDWRFYFDVTYTQDTSANTSKVTSKAYIQFKNMSGSLGTFTVYVTNKIDGSNYNISKSITQEGDTTYTIGSSSKTITHNEDGTRSFSFQGVGNFAKMMYTSNVTINLPTIDRQSTPTLNVNQATLGSTSVRITTNRASGVYLHKLTYSLGNLTNQTIATNVGEYYDWIPPLTLANQISKESAIATITCTTYASDGTTQVGNPTTVNLTLQIPDSVKPSCSLSISEDNTSVVPSSWGVWIQGKSRIKGTITASGSYGSTISSYKATANNQTFSTKDFVSSIVNVSGSHTISATVTDSRNRTASASKTITVYAYAIPKISNLVVTRCNSDGTANQNGTSVKVTFNYNVSSVNNKNTKSANVQYRVRNTGSYTNKAVTLSAYSGSAQVIISDYEFSTSKSYDINVQISDYFTSETFSSEGISTISKPISVRKGGKGIAFGKIAELDDVMEIAYEMRDRFGTTIGNGVTVYKGGKLDANTTMEELLLTTVNTPTSDFWYVRTMFYPDKNSTSARTQVAYPYNKNNGSLYQRYYYDGTWSAWTKINVGKLVTTATSAQSTSSGESFGGTINLHKISKTGTYSDLIGKPTALSQFTNDSGFITASASKAGTGYIKFSNGVIVQWGTCTAGTTKTMPLSFTSTTSFVVVGSGTTQGASATVNMVINAVNKFTAYAKHSSTYYTDTIQWIAVGY